MIKDNDFEGLEMIIANKIMKIYPSIGKYLKNHTIVDEKTRDIIFTGDIEILKLVAKNVYRV